MPYCCFRCDRTYCSISSYHQHVRDSPNHHECPECDFDGTTWDELLDHLCSEGCRDVCQDCDDGQGAYWNAYGYSQHVRDFNVCTDCERHFTTPSHLYQHRLSHRKLNFECIRCTNRFKTYGGMIIHLEHGVCSHVNIYDLNKIASRCYGWDEFIEQDNYHGLYYYGDAGYGNPFKCPTCDAHFNKLSSLFQHIESSSCEQTLYHNAISELRRELADSLS